jgi:hypothetical protein
MPGKRKSRKVPQLSVSESEVKITGALEQESDLQIRGTFDGEIHFENLIVEARGAAIDGRLAVRALTIGNADMPEKTDERKGNSARAKREEDAGLLPPFLVVKQSSLRKDSGLAGTDEAAGSRDEQQEKKRGAARLDFI